MEGDATAQMTNTQPDGSEPEEECVSLVFTHCRKPPRSSSSAQSGAGGGVLAHR